MALLAGLVVALFLLLAFHLLGWSARNPRWLVAGALVLVALYAYGTKQLEDDIQNVGLVAARSADCPVNQVQVLIVNGRQRDITGFSFSLRGYRPNYSEYVAYDHHRTDRIIPPGGEWITCWPVEDLQQVPTAQKATLRWEVEFTDLDYAE